MIEFSNVMAGYGTHPVLKGVDLQIKKGQNLSILGPNGCGKTTLLKTLAGLLPYEGSIKVQGLEVRDLGIKELAGKLSLLSQTSSAYFSYTVQDAVMLGRYQTMKKSIFGTLPTPKDREAVKKWLKKTGLWELRDQKIDRLSGGQLQRVFFAQTLVSEPDILLLDEPTNHLDIKYQVELVDDLREWAAAEQKTVIGVFHDLNLALRLSDDLVFLNKGRIAGAGPSSKLLTASFLKDIYQMDINGYMLECLRKWEQLERRCE